MLFRIFVADKGEVDISLIRERSTALELKHQSSAHYVACYSVIHMSNNNNPRKQFKTKLRTACTYIDISLFIYTYMPNIQYVQYEYSIFMYSLYRTVRYVNINE